MKRFFTFLIVLGSLTSYCQDYTIHINDSTYEISLDKKYDVIVKGKKISFSVSSHDILNYNDSACSFMYHKEIMPSKARIQDKVDQITVITAEGNGFLVQEYGTTNPTALNEFMLKEITKESVGYGFTSVRKDYKRTLKSGQSIDVCKAELTYNDKVYTYEVASIGKKDAGVVIVTMLLSENIGKGKASIDLFWDTFQYK